MAIEIERFKQEYLDEVKEIAGLSIETREPIKYYLSFFNDFFYVAKENGKVISFLIFKLSEDLDSGELIILASHPDFRRRGAASALINYAKDHMKRLQLHVKKSNHEAIKLYFKLGFARADEIANFYPGDENAILMVWKK